MKITRKERDSYFNMSVFEIYAKLCNMPFVHHSKVNGKPSRKVNNLATFCFI